MMRNKKPVCVEFYTVKRIDNSRLVRHVEPVELRNYYRMSALGCLIAFCFMLYIYQHFRCIDLSFQLEDLKAQQTQASTLNGELKLELAGLRDPHRIDVIARKKLGLTELAPAQVREYNTAESPSVTAAHYVRPNTAP